MYIDSDTKIQVLHAVNELPCAEKEQCAAFIVRTSLCDFQVALLADTMIRVNDSEKSMPSLYGRIVSKI